MQMVTFAVSGIGYSTIYYLFWIFATPIKISNSDLGPLTDSMTTPGVTPEANASLSVNGPKSFSPILIGVAKTQNK